MYNLTVNFYGLFSQCLKFFLKKVTFLPQPCFVQSPGYPGVYPRGLDCRYYLSTREPLIKLYVDRSPATTSSSSSNGIWSAPPGTFDVGGQDCDSLYMCPFRYMDSNI